MVWCSSCAKDSRPYTTEGKICCSFCGRVLDEDNFSVEPTFVKNAAGQSQLAGNYVKTVQSDYSASRERILDEAYRGIEAIMYALGIDGGDSISRPALSFYTIAVERNFTRGRRKEQVEAACLYIACRENKKPFLLIDFSEYLRINVYVLGAVFLQLCKLLSLEEHPIVQKPVDPSLFIHRFTDRLFGERKPTVSRTALHIVASMKRDWMQTGRKPSGLCGAALYISALSQGLNVSKSDVIKVVHVCEATLTKRLIEFENTESGSLTIEEFNIKADEFEKEARLNNLSFTTTSHVSGKGELLCEHKGSGRSAFAHGLCKSCYSDFMQLSGGLDGGSEPPAFQRAERERVFASQTSCGTNSGQQENLQLNEPESADPSPKDTQQNNFHEAGSLGPSNSTESENLSDIDDDEVIGYLHSEDEKHLKKIIWEKMNKEYMEEQAAKEAARKSNETNFDNCSEDMIAAKKLHAAAEAAVAKSRKERQQKRAAELRNLTPAQTAAEATKQMLTRKRLGSKINYDELDKLFDQSNTPERDSKRSRSMSPVHDESPFQSKQSPDLGNNYEEEEYGTGVDYEGQDYDNAEGYYGFDAGYDYDD